MIRADVILAGAARVYSTVGDSRPGDSTLGGVDLLIIGAYVAVSLLVGFYFARRGNKTAEDFFVSGRSLPWWVAGTALVATTFSADTPLAVTELVCKHGVAGNWLWWGMLFSGMTTVFFFARLWRRAEVMTDVELAELRYSGKPAAFLRGFRAAYLGLLANLVIMGWVNLGMARVLQGTLAIDETVAIGFCLVATALYSLVSGYRGVAAAGGFQFLVAMGGAILLAFYAVDAAGGIDAIRERLASAHPANPKIPGTTFGTAAAAMSFLPAGADAWSLPIATFSAYVALNWWATWYPGAEPGGGGYVAQSISACRDERHGRGAVMLFNFAHYAIRSWPWILVALASLVLFPDFVKDAAGHDDPGLNYVRTMNRVLPGGLRGLMLASFAAAYMSTQATQMSWGSSYLINDLYRRFLAPGRSDRHYSIASRVAVLVTLVLSCVVTKLMTQVSASWEFLLSIGAGTGLVYILRWYWWRINAWSEISAMIAALAAAVVVKYSIGDDVPGAFGLRLGAATLATSIVWIGVTFATAAEPIERLASFYRKIRPAGPGWGPVAKACGLEPIRGEIGSNLLNTGLGIMFIYGALFTSGGWLLHETQYLWVTAAACFASGSWLTIRLVRGK